MKKIQAVEKNGNGDDRYLVGTPENSKFLTCEKWSNKSEEIDLWIVKVPVPPPYIYETPVYNMDNAILRARQ